MDPYLTIDHLVISQPQFRPHPHAGFSAITLMFEDSPGSISNRDSTGTHTLLKPGDLHWTQAGSGVVNEEVPAEPRRRITAHRVFIDLPTSV
jgi:redox-sensitive bicupin YhaK (pirin superfamily)